MGDGIEERLAAATARLRRYESTTARLEDLGGRMSRIEAEIADLRAAHAREVAIDGTTRFIDVWFDNIFTDFSVAQRIGAASERVSDRHNRVAALIAELGRRTREAQQRLSAIEVDRHDLLTRP